MKIKKHFKKFILVSVLLILFNFCCPKNVEAKSSLVQNITAAPAKIFWLIEEGVLTFLNNIFTEDSKSAENKSTMDSEGNIVRQLKIYLTPETIIKGKFLLMDANIFKNIDEAASDPDYYYDDETTTKADSATTDSSTSADTSSDTSGDTNTNNNGSVEQTTRNNIVQGKKELRDTISGWYLVLRNFSIVMLLSVLVYVGIRMVISTVAQDKAKYKAMFKDWLVALCLLIAMHIFMIGILNISSEITKALGSGKNADMIGNITEIIQEVLNDEEEESYTYTKSSSNTVSEDDVDQLLDDNSDTSGSDSDSDSDSESEGTEVYTLSDAYANILVLGGIIVYIVIFAIKYLKREFTIIFLILLGPVSCITYPIDKIGDGKAQAFNRWFAEFLYQVIIQPFHLLLYIILIGTAANLANTNVIYALVCFAVMGPAEKFIKEMFGFKDKFGSPLGSMMKAGMARDFVSKATSRLMSGGSSGGNGSNGKNGIREKDNDAINPPRENIDNNLLGGGDDTADSGPDGPDNPDTIDDQNVPQIDDNTDANGGVEGIEEPDRFDFDVTDGNDPRAQRFNEAATGQREALLAMSETDDPTKRSEYEELYNSYGRDIEELENPDWKNWQNSGDVAEMAGDAAGIATLDAADGGNTRTPVETEGDRTQELDEMQRQINNVDLPEGTDGSEPTSELPNNRKPENLRSSTWDNIKATHARRMAEKYGTTNKGKQWRRRLGRGAKKGIRALAKGTLIAGAATVGAGVALVTGNGAEAAAILGGAAALGVRSGVKTIKGVAKGAKGATKDYYRNGAFPLVSSLGADNYERAFNAFESDPQQIQRATENYRLVHGHGPDSEQLELEMQDRFALSTFKLSDDQIDNAVIRYQELRETPGMTDNKAMQQAALEAQLADRYKGKFGKEREMQDAIKAVTKRFTDAGVKDQALAEQNAIRYLNGAAKMNKETMILPDGKEVVEAPIRIPNVSTQLEIEGSSGFGEVEAQRMNEITLKLVQMDYTTEEIRKIASSSADSKQSAVQVLDNYEAKVEFISGQRSASRRFVAETKGINERQVSSQDLKVEDKRRLELRDKFNVPEQSVDKVRKVESKLEKKQVTTQKTQAQVSWETSKKIKGADKGRMHTVEQDIVNQLVGGGSSTETAQKDAKAIMRTAKRLNGIIEKGE